jgi:tryptophan synthase alpha chain
VSLISAAFRPGRKALVGYLTAGFPSWAAFTKAFRDLESGGADVIEIGVPFSDPIADGPTIQAASQKALLNGVNLKSILTWVTKERRRSQIPVVLMSYLNPILRLGLDRFAAQAARAGVDGLIVPDTIPEETVALSAALAGRGIDLIHLAAPTTPPDRRQWVASKSRGFLYAVSVVGVTGARKDFPPEAAAFIRSLKKISPVPVAVGFGISTPDHARAAAALADGVIVGSALLNRVREGKPLLPFVQSIRAALDAKSPGGRHGRQ